MRSGAEISVSGKIERNGPRMVLSSCLHILFGCAGAVLRVPLPDHSVCRRQPCTNLPSIRFACCGRSNNGGDYPNE